MFTQCNHILYRQVLATESRSCATCVIINDGFDSRIKTRAQKEQSTDHDKDMDNSHQRAESTIEQFTLVQLPVSNREEDESEE